MKLCEPIPRQRAIGSIVDREQISFTPGFSPVIAGRENKENRFNGLFSHWLRRLLLTTDA